MSLVHEERSTQATIQQMFDELRTADPIFSPSAFWEHYNQKNLDQLSRLGIDRFKRTVNQNYYNWLPSDFSDHQLQQVVNHWRANPAIGPLQARLAEFEHLETVVDSNPLGTAEKRATYALFVGLLWHHARRSDALGLLDRLSEPDVGAPIPVMLDGRCISQDLANSARECNAAMSILPWRPTAARRLKVAEIGAGYGRLAYVYSAGMPSQIMIFDIPPALGISQEYLTRTLPNKKIFTFRHFDRFEDVRNEIEAADACFFTPNQLAYFPERYFDVFNSVSSLQEMTFAQIDNYKKLIERTTNEVVYLKQWTTSINPFDKIVINRRAYKLSRDWKPQFDRLDDVFAKFFEIGYRRRGSAVECDATSVVPMPISIATAIRGGDTLRRLTQRVLRKLDRMLGD
jgi:putative sugar O-methyltransferase